MTAIEKAKQKVDSLTSPMDCYFSDVDSALEDLVIAAQKVECEACAEIVERVANIRAKLGHFDEAAILRTLAQTIRARTEPGKED